ncbi:carbohydrate ABC transporter permease [Streptomyces sp. NBC_01005]|uniref:carbohydrate ABC transporter permease n=1 Tax=unclassified Streptomyces TaxID=2593676 RepID=UPI002E34D4E5|nr:carbohydrate ABC transporter permease [Streptomyces sp. NBC_01362]WSW09576.1 carbohydrate ABC transporter permease [Streptomyces sp. NBC_01005]WTC99081.1 carbohydrate ABC transporter permease [Streptomyces sp. NBC_01650]
MSRRKNSRDALRLLVYLFLTAVAIITLVPLVYAFFASFKPSAEILTSGSQLFPTTWTLDNYVRAWEMGGFSQYLLNSVVVAAGVVGIDIFASSMLGYLLARRAVPFHRAIFSVMSFTLFVGVGTATLYPRLEIAQILGVDNLLGVILVELSGIGIIHVFLIRAFCESLPIELEEAGRLDGLGLFGVYSRLALPLMRPILATTGVLAFQEAWNNFQIPYVFTISDQELRTLVVGVFALRSTSEGTQAYDLMLAGAMLIVVPIVILFFAFQRFFIQGMTEGSVKG